MAIFPLDITGTASTNRIPNEIIPIVPASAEITGPAPYVLLQYAPFFADNFSISHNGTPLVRGQHFDFIGQNLHASKYIGKDLFAGVYFFNNNISGNVTCSYNTLGDTWVQNNYQHIASFYNTYYAQQMINWDRVFGVPYQLPPLIHPEPLDSLMGVDDIVAVLEEIKAAVENSSYSTVISSINALAGSLTTHTGQTNPHNTTKANIGLGLVENSPSAGDMANLYNGTPQYLRVGTEALWNLIQAGLFQQGINLTAQDPLTTNAVIFRSNTLADINMPPTGLIEDFSYVYVLQIRAINSSGQRTAALNTVPRIQIGFAVAEAQPNSCLLIRELPGGATGSHPWSVIPSWNLLQSLISP